VRAAVEKVIDKYWKMLPDRIKKLENKFILLVL